MDWLRVDHCRALGNTLAAFFTGRDGISIVNSTFHGQGDGLIMGGPREGFECTGTETMTARNNIFAGSADYFDPSDITFLFYQEGCPGLKLDADYNIVHNAKNIECGAAGDHAISGTHDLCEDPLLTGPLFGMEFGMMPGPHSPAIDAGENSICSSVEILGAPRPADGNGDGNSVCNIGAYETP